MDLDLVWPAKVGTPRCADTTAQCGEAMAPKARMRIRMGVIEGCSLPQRVPKSPELRLPAATANPAV
jgi:hypothetical protein